MVSGNVTRAAQAERTVATICFFHYVRFFLNALLDLLLDPLTLSGSLVLHFTLMLMPRRRLPPRRRRHRRRRRQIYIRPNPPTLSFVCSRRFVVDVSAIALFFLAYRLSPLDAIFSSWAHFAHPSGMLTRYGTVVRCWFDGVRECHSRSAGGTNGGGDMFLPLRTFLSQRAARSTSRCSDLIRVPRSSLYCGGSL